MNHPPHAGLVAALGAAGLLLCTVTIMLPLFGTSTAHAACQTPVRSAPSGQPIGGGWSPTQQRHARTIVDAGKQRSVPPRAWVIALATAMQESSLLNQANSTVPRSLQFPHDKVGRDHDSLGLFQQRVSPPDGQGTWGSVEELMNPATGAGKFYHALSNVHGWEKMRLTDAAQAVQRSAYPHAYQKWEPAAEKLAAAIIGVADIDDIGGGTPLAPCGAAGFDPIIIGPGGWTQPVHALIVSAYGPRGGRLHAGVDLGATRHTPIRAASAGTVTKVRCDSGSGTCDRDGGIGIGGCGWYVEVRHQANVVSRYCHMVQRPEVHIGQHIKAGHVIGFVGSSGNSSGPHLHYEIHVNVQPGGPVNNENATDPEKFMRAAGAELGK